MRTIAFTIKLQNFKLMRLVAPKLLSNESVVTHTHTDMRYHAWLYKPIVTWAKTQRGKYFSPLDQVSILGLLTHFDYTDRTGLNLNICYKHLEICML